MSNEVKDASIAEIDAAIKQVGVTEQYPSFGDWRAAVNASILRSRAARTPHEHMPGPPGFEDTCVECGKASADHEVAQ